jgi:sulfhydrogenase subunit beta (sulfur reductase)
MQTLVMQKEAIGRFVSDLKAGWTVVGPKSKETQVVFAPIEDPSELCLTYSTSILPPGRALFPAREPLLDFRRDDLAATRQILEGGPTILFGVHPCDVHGINILDEVMTDGPVDSNYAMRRSQCRIIALECLGPCTEQSLCFDKGTHRIEWGFDLLLCDLGDRYFVYVPGAPGEELVAGKDYFTRAASSDRLGLEKAREAQAGKMATRLPQPVHRLPGLIKDSYEDFLWEAIGRKCLSCGTCTNVCPTCNCYDQADEMALDLCGGTRCRVWDSCQSPAFAAVGSGENFRERASARQRHRIFKKEVFQFEKYGRSACVGCGRCSSACVAKIRLTEIYQQLMEA